MNTDAQLKPLRDEINRIDARILTLLNERAKAAIAVGKVKGGEHLYRPEREAQVLHTLAQTNQGPMPDGDVTHIFREIMSACLALEQPMRIGYLGPAGTFSESAANQHFGAAPTFLPQASIAEVFRAVEAGALDYGVVPVENSTEGAVGATLDLLLASPLRICGETRLRIHHHILSTQDKLDGLERLYSHAQSLAQCSQWLARNLPNLAQIPVASNAEAARLAAEDARSCAIAGDAAARHYALQTLASNIEDDANNTTRFFVIGRHDNAPCGQDKTSLVCATSHLPGAIHDVLEPFSRHRINMTKLQSRPARAGLWEYVFFIDIEGHPLDPDVARALQEITARAAFVKVLGAYPVPLN